MTRSKDVVQIALLFIENELGSEEFINKLEDHIIPSMHNIDIDEMSDLIYALMCSKVQLKLSWIERISDVILSRVEEMNIK